MNRYIIVGTGVAGIAAAEALRTSDRSAEITLIGDDPHGFYSRPGLAYYLTDEIPKQQLYIFSEQDWRGLNVRYVKGRVTRLHPQGHRVELGAAGALTYDRLLLATGATALRLSSPGAHLSGVVKLDHFDDALGILALTRRARTAVVVGGGITALELAEGLAAHGVKVHYLLRGDRYWSNALDEVESRIVEQRLVNEGIQLHYRAEVAEILGRGGKVSGVRTTQGEVLRCGMVAVAIGIQARLELAQAAGLATERGILTNEYLQTSASDIFAAGDVAQVLDPLTGQAVLDSLWGPAREQGAAAGWNMVGQRRVYRKAIAFNVTRLAGLTTTIIGTIGGGRDDDLVSITRGSSETWRQLPNTIAMETGSEVNHLRLMLGEKTLLGALVMGEQMLSVPLQELILKQVDISPLRTQLLQANAPLGHLVMEYWNRWRTHAAQ